MPLYQVKVRVDFDFEIEAEDEAAAEAEGWKWEDYTQWSDVYDIQVDELDDPDADEEEDE